MGSGHTHTKKKTTGNNQSSEKKQRKCLKNTCLREVIFKHMKNSKNSIVRQASIK